MLQGYSYWGMHLPNGNAKSNSTYSRWPSLSKREAAWPKGRHPLRTGSTANLSPNLSSLQWIHTRAVLDVQPMVRAQAGAREKREEENGAAEKNCDGPATVPFSLCCWGRWAQRSWELWSEAEPGKKAWWDKSVQICLCFSLSNTVLIGYKLIFHQVESVLPVMVTGRQSPCLYPDPEAFPSYSHPLSCWGGGMRE